MKFVIETKKNDFSEQLSKFNGCTKVLCPSTYCTKLLSPDVDFIPRLSFTSLMTE